MKSSLYVLTLGLAGLLVLADDLHAQDLARFVAKPGGGSKVTIEGTSTIHDWTMEGSIIGGFIEIDPKVADPAAAPAAGKVNAKVDVLIPVRSLKSGKQTMDNVYCDAMNEAKYSRITFKLKELSLKEAGKANEKLTMDSTGELTVSGTTNEIKMAVTIERMSADKMKITGSIPIKMTSYNVKPPQPAIAGGLIKTGDDVKLGLEWVVEKRN